MNNSTKTTTTSCVLSSTSFFKSIALALAILVQLVLVESSHAQCYTATYGLYPSTTFTPTCTGAFANIVTDGYGSEYSNVNLVAGNTYTFKSSVTTDYITVDNDGAAPLVGVIGVSGTAGINWTCTATGTYRFYTHTSSTCGASTANRTRSIKCVSATPATPPANDACAAATSLPCGTSALAGTTVNSVSETAPNGCASSFGVWYTFTGDGQQTTITSTTTFDHELTISSGSCGALTNIACVDLSTGTETYTFNTVVGTVYWIYVARWSTTSTITGTFTMSRTCTPIATCFPPTTLTSSSITSTTATISWTAESSAPSSGYQYYVSTSGAAPLAGTTPTGSVGAGITTANLTGLTANTTHYYWVRSNCGGSGTSTWAGSSTFFTGYCPPSSYSVDDIGITNVTFGTGPTVNNTTGAEANNYGNYSAQIGGLAQSSSATISMTFNTEIYPYTTGIYVDWNNDLDFADAGELVWSGVSGDVSPNTLVATFTVPGSSVIGANYRMRIGGDDSGVVPAACATGLTYACFEDYTIIVTAPPSCISPTALISGAITSTTATISWTAASPAPSSGYQYYVSTSSTAPLAETAPTGSVGAGITTANLTGLTANTTHYYWVRSNCGGSGSSTWAGSSSFFTGVISIIPLTGSTSVACGTSTLIYDNGGSAGNYGTGASGYIVLNNALGSTSVITLSGTYSGIEGCCDNFKIYSGSGTGGALLYTYGSLGSGTIATFSSAAGETITIQFNSDGSVGGAGISLNAVYSGSCAIPACSGTPAPGNTISSPSFVAVPSGNVNLSLQNATVGTGVTYQWESSTSQTGTYTNIVGATSSTYTATVSSVTWFRCIVTCSGNSGTSAPVQVTLTACIPTMTYGCAEGDVIARVILNTLDNNSGTGCPSGTLGYSNYTSNPALTTTLQPSSSYNCVVYAGQYNANYAAWIDYNDNLVFEASERIGNTTSVVAGSGIAGTLGSSASFPVTLACTPPAGQHILRIREVYGLGGSLIDPCTNNQGTSSFFGYGETEDYMITISAAPACPSAGALTSTGATTTSASFSWTLGCATATNYDFEYGETGFTPGTGTTLSNQAATIAAGAGSFTLNGLTPSTFYDVYYRGVCNGSVSSWSAVSTVNTTGHCIPSSTGTSYYLSNIQTTGAIVNFNNTTTLSTNGYGNYSGTHSVSAFAGYSFNLSASGYVQDWFNTYQNFSKVWVDWNKDLDFDDAGETMYTSPTSISSLPFSASLAVPAGQALGSYKMRIRMDMGTAALGGVLSPCGQLVNGETEDYTIKVIQPNPPTLSSVSQPTLFCPGATVTLTGANFYNVTGVTIGGQPVLSYNVVNATTITAVTNYDGAVVVTNAFGASISAISSSFTAVPPSTPVTSVSSLTALYGASQTVSIVNPNSSLTYNWYGSSGNSLGTGESVNVSICLNQGQLSVVAVNNNSSACPSSLPGIISASTLPQIISSEDQFCGVGSGIELTATNLLSSALILWESLTAGVDLSSTSANPTSATIVNTSDFKLTVSVAGCPDYIIFKSIGVYPLPTANLTTSASGVCPGSSVTINSGLSAGNFSVFSVPYAPFAIPSSATTIVSNGVANIPLSGGSLDDGGWGGIPIGFNFNYFGTNFSTIAAGTNGLLMFGTVPGYTTAQGNLGQYSFNSTNGVFPNTANPGNVIALMAGDQYFGSGTAASSSSELIYWTEGYAPNRRFVILYKDVNRCCGATNPAFTAYAVLWETLGIVDIHILNSDQSGSSNTVGLQNGLKDIGAVAPGRQNFTTSISAPEAWRFSPPSNFSTIWTAAAAEIANGTNIFTIPVSPSVQTTYDISYTNQTTGCSSEPGSAQVTVNVLGNSVIGDFAATAAVSSTCIGTAVPLTHTYVGPYANAGLSYQWESSVNGGSWLDIVGATLATYSAVPSVATSYRVGIKSCSGTEAFSSPVSISISDYMTCYCTPNTGYASDEEITNVTLSTLNNSSTCEDVAPGLGSVAAVYGNYTDFPATNLFQGMPVSGSLTIGSCGSYSGLSGSAIFIDYNHNGLFTDAGEKVWSNGSTANIQCVPASTVSASFTPPLTSVSGLTRMRIISSWNTAGVNILPCTSPGWGEVEDYMVNIVPPPAAPATPTATNAGSCILGDTISMSGTAPEGVAYYWQTTATGTSLDNSASTWIVYGNGTYYIRAYASLGGQWSTATAITLGAFPIIAPPTAITNLSGTPYCAAVTLQAGAAPFATTYYWQGTNPIGISNALPASSNATATASGTYYIAARNDTTLCWSATTSISVVVYPAPTGTAVASLPVSCPSPNASVLFNVSGAGTVFSSDFSSTLPAGATLVGNNAGITTNGRLRLTSAENSKNGGILIQNLSGVSANDYQVDFDFITTSSGTSTPADGLSYSYGPDVVGLPTGLGSTIVGAAVDPGTTNPENGSGSALKLAFDAYTNGANQEGVYLMYNTPIWNQSPTSTGVLNYSPSVAWRATPSAGASTHVTIKVNPLGQLSMWLNGVVAVSNQQLPPSYLSDDKSTWKHALSARTGDLNEGHFIDNLTIKYNMLEYSIDNTTWTTVNPIPAAPGTYNASVRYAGVGGCVVSLGSVTIAPIAAPTITVSTPVPTVCFGAPVTFTANIANQGSLPSVCNYTFNMVDSWGDGWNGAQMKVMNGTTVVATLTGPAYSYPAAGLLAQSVSLQSGISYTLEWATAGSYPGEVGVSVVSPSGTTIYTMLPSGYDPPLSGTLTTIAPSSLLAYSTIAWQVNNVAVSGANGLTYTPSSLNAGDYVTASVIINYPCPSNTVVSTPIFVVANTSVTTTVTAASSYTWADNGQTYTASGVYTGTTTNCVTQMLNLTILPTLTLNVLLDGYYVIGSSPAEMRAARYNNLVAAIPSGAASAAALAALSGNTQDVDLITVQLRGTTSGLPILHTATPMLKKDGSVICEFPASAIGGSYYVVVDHRASMPLWSQNPITLSNSSTLNFANTLASAYSDTGNDALLTPMKTISSGLYGVWMGELDQDGYLDAFDYSNLEGDIYQSQYLGQYLLDGDLNGDSYVDASDYAVYDGNSIRGLYEQRPY